MAISGPKGRSCGASDDAEHRDAGRAGDAPAARPGIPPLFIALAIALACADNFADPDLWMHLRVGQAILHSGQIPAHDIYSYSAAGAPWRNHEWLAQTAMAAAYAALGIIGLKLLKVICAAIAISALAIGLKKTAARGPVQRMVLVLTAAALTTQMQFRPQLFTFALLSIVMAALAAELYRGPVRLWPLVPMFALWANLHGGYTAGLGALAIAAAVLSLQEVLAGGWPTRGLRIAGVAFLCAIATLFNPYGIGIWSNVMHSVSDPLIKLIVQDWVPLPAMIRYEWHTAPAELLQFLLPLALFSCFFVSLLIAPTADDAALAAIGAVFIAAAFHMSRNVALAVIALAIPMAHHLEVALVKRGPAAAGADSDALGNRGGRILFGCLIAGVAAVGGLFSNRLPAWKPIPKGAVAFMQERGLHGNLLDQFEWGEYLIWHLAPDSRVFIDGRTELVYPDSVLLEYAKLYYDRPGARPLLERYPHDFILVSRDSGIYRAAVSDPGWQVIYSDEVAVLFARTDARIAPAQGGSPTAHTGSYYFP